MDPRRDLERVVYRVRDLGCMGRLEEFGLARSTAADRGYVHDEIYQLQLVAQVQRHQACPLYRLFVDRRDPVCVGCRLFH